MRRWAADLGRRARALDPTLQGLLWATAAGLLFTLLNGLMRALSLQLDPYQTQFLRYVFGVAVLLPMVWRHGLAAYRPKAVGGQFVRGFVHTVGMGLMFTRAAEDSARRDDGDRLHDADLHHARCLGLLSRGDALGALARRGGRLRRRADRRRPRVAGRQRHLQPRHARLGRGVRGLVPDQQGAHALRDHRHRSCSGSRSP